MVGVPMKHSDFTKGYIPVLIAVSPMAPPAEMSRHMSKSQAGGLDGAADIATVPR